jgi:hypothetical protein
MTPEHFGKIEKLYHAVRECSPEERAVWLEQADPELRREVESLLAGQSGGEFLDRPGRPEWERSYLEPVFLRDLAYLRLHKGTEAAAEFQKRLR